MRPALNREKLSASPHAAGRPSIVTLPKVATSIWLSMRRKRMGTERTSDAGLVLQLTRVGFLLLLWLFIWSVLRILRTDIYAPTGAVMVRRGLPLRGSLLPNRGRRNVARQLVVTEERSRERASPWAPSRC